MDQESSCSLKRRTSYAAVYLNPEWENIYLFVESEGTAICLVCHKVLRNMKKFNLQRHYTTYHAKDFEQYNTIERAAEINKLKVSFLTSIAVESEAPGSELCVRVSYKIALQIAKSLRSLSEGEFVKECLQIAAELLCPSQLELFTSVSLSRATVTRHIQDLSGDIFTQFQDILSSSIAFSLALDESTDVCSTAQLCIFIRSVNCNLQVTEELLDIIPMRGTTTGLDILTSVEECVDNIGIPWNLLVSVTTDGAPSMTGRNVGFVQLLKNKFPGQTIASVHCIIHQENLCAKHSNVPHVMAVVVKVTNKIRTNGLKHRQFKEFLEELETEYCDIPYYSEVRWLSRGRLLNRFFELLEEISLFMEMNGSPIPELRDDKWRADFAFLVDLTEHLNKLNTTLQGKNQLITQLHDSIEAFKKKLQLWERQLSVENTSHFSHLASFGSSVKSSDFKEYVTIIQSLLEEFENRFADVAALESEFKIFATPFNVIVDDVPSHLQLELIDLQCDREIRVKYDNRSSLTQFYQDFPQPRFPRLHKHVARLMSMFGSTDLCEQLFSRLKQTKSCYRNKLTDYNLRCALRISSSQSITTNIDNIIQNKRCQKSKKLKQ